MTTPAWSLSAAFGIAPGAVVDPGDWTDISADTEEFHPNTGRRDGWSQFPAGTMTATLDNHLGNYDPEHAAGPHFGDLVPLTPMRLLLGEGTATEDAFYGYVSLDGWRVVPDPPEDSACQITCVDLLDVLANMDAPSSPFAAELEAYEPDHWWRLADPVGSTEWTNSGFTSSAPSTIAGPVVLGVESPVTNETVSAMEITLGSGLADAFDVTGLGIAGDFVASFVLEWDGTGRGLQPLTGFDASTTWFFYVQGDADGTGPFLQLTVSPPLGGVVTTAKVRPSFPAVLHIAVRRSGFDWSLLVNGSATAVVTAGANFTIDHLEVSSNAALSTTPTIKMADLAVFETSIPTNTELAVMSTAMHDAWESDTTGERIARLAAAAGVDADLTRLELGLSTMPAATLGGTILQAMRDAETAEHGRLYVDHRDGGRLRFLDRASLTDVGTNLLDAESAGFETTVGDWTAGAGCTVARSTAQAHAGTASLKITGTAATCYATLPTGVSGIPIVQHRDLNVVVRAKAGTVQQSIAARVSYFDTTGSQLSPNTLSGGLTYNATAATVLDTTTGWTTGSGTVEPPTGAAYASLALQYATAVGEEHFFDSLILSQGRIGSDFTAVMADIGDDGSTEVPYSGLTLGDEVIFTQVTVSKEGGTPVTAINRSSAISPLVRGLSQTGLLIESATEPAERAAWLLSVRGVQRRTCHQVVLEPRKSTHSAWPVVFDVRIGDRVTVSHRPPYGGTYSYTCIVEGVEHSWSQAVQEWRTVLSLSPYLSTSYAT